MKRALLITAALITSCSLLGPSGPSTVAKGEYYAAGKPTFDGFFVALYELQVEILVAPEETVRARSELAQTLSLGPEASDQSVEQRLRTEVQKALQAGVRTRLEVPDSSAVDASTILHASEGNWATPLRAALPLQATRLLRSRNQMQAVLARLDKLQITSIALEGHVDRDFRVDGPWKRDEVRRNLSDGQKLITLMQGRAKDVLARDVKLLNLLAVAATTDASLGVLGVGATKAPEEESKPARRGPRRMTPVATPGRRGGSPNTEAPAKPRAAEDEATTPKPVPGTAPAEIEP